MVSENQSEGLRRQAKLAAFYTWNAWSLTFTPQPNFLDSRTFSFIALFLHKAVETKGILLLEGHNIRLYTEANEFVESVCRSKLGARYGQVHDHNELFLMWADMYTHSVSRFC
jgi:hypothetical protein